MLAVFLIDLPVMSVILHFEGKKINGRFGPDGVVLYREKASWKKFALVFKRVFVVIYLLVSPISTYLTEKVFSGLPDWMNLEERTKYTIALERSEFSL
jgi:hypothetical protein